jgi:hypothetical protein
MSNFAQTMPIEHPYVVFMEPGGWEAITGDKTMRTNVCRQMCAGAVVAASLTIGPQMASAQGYASLSCGQLWQERNEIFADYGYCFKTPQAISAFGRACFPPYGRLSKSAQARVDNIIFWEQRKGCSG